MCGRRKRGREATPDVRYDYCTVVRGEGPGWGAPQFRTGAGGRGEKEETGKTAAPDARGGKG